MKDKDTRILTEAYENLYAGIVDEEDDNKEEDKEDKESEEKEDSKNDEESDDEESDDEESDDEESDDEESDDEKSDDEESDDEESDDEESDDNELNQPEEGDKGVQNKIQTLQKQYNDVLVDAFSKYAPECIEVALEGNDNTFGENIEEILNTALDALRDKVLGDFGIETEPAIGNLPATPGGIVVDLGSKGKNTSEEESEEDM